MSPVAIIGAGFTGTLTAIHLALRLPDRPVILFEESPEAGPGLAYRQDDAHALLNVPARRMSAFPDEPDHFYNHVRRLLGDTVSPEDFLPRRVYGAYLKSCLEEALGRCPNLRVDHRSVVDLQAAHGGEGVVLTFRDHTTQDCSRVVLASGNQGSAFASSIWARHTLCARQAATYQKITPGSTVLVIGTGLTMIDAVLELERQGLAAEIHSISRNGLVPRSYHPITGKPVPDLSGLQGAPLRKAVRLFRRALAEHKKEGGDWRDLFAALRPTTPALWQALSLRDRQRFLRFISPFWEVHRHQCAPPAGEKFEKLVGLGKLRLSRGTIVSVEKDQEGGKLRLGLAARNRAAATRWLDADHIIDATGPARDIGTITHPLITNLLRRGFIVPDEHRLGTKIDGDYHAIQRGGDASKWLFVTGPMLRASFFEATAVPELRQHASFVAAKVAAELEAPVKEVAPV